MFSKSKLKKKKQQQQKEPTDRRIFHVLHSLLRKLKGGNERKHLGTDCFLFTTLGDKRKESNRIRQNAFFNLEKK